MSATDDDIRRVLLSLRELRDRIDALEATVSGIAGQVGYVPPVPPRWSAAVQAALDRGDRRGAILLLARERGVSKYVAEQALDKT